MISHLDLSSKFKLLLAVSADGYVARGPDDDMRWTGVLDKRIFRLLTLSSPILLAGAATAKLLPPLPDRTVMPLSRGGIHLGMAAVDYPDAWLIGGPTVALAALKQRLVGVAVICRTEAVLGGGIPFAPIRWWLGGPRQSVPFELGSSQVIVDIHHFGV